MIVIADASVLIHLAKAEAFFILERLFGKIIIASSVYREVVDEGRGKEGAREVAGASWIGIRDVHDQKKVLLLLQELDRGEAESIVLATEQRADLVLVDERRARAVLARIGIPIKGTIGILLEAHRKGMIADVKEALDRLIAGGFWIDRKWYEKAIEAAK